MFEIIVKADPDEGGDGAVVLRERVTPRNLESEHYAGQLIERIEWAVVDASEVGSREQRPEVSSRATP
jgi:hypothetical protein